MKPIDFFDRLDQASEAGDASHAWRKAAGWHASFRVGQQASAASSPAALQCIFLAMYVLTEKSKMCYELPFSRTSTRMICR
jgi:hypothetical protein